MHIYNILYCVYENGTGLKFMLQQINKHTNQQQLQYMHNYDIMLHRLHIKHKYLLSIRLTV